MPDLDPKRWLSFSNSDQKILSAETYGVLWDALVVPGTLATYYKQGVGGYVLASRRPYVIDPRTPLLQRSALNPRPEPRASQKTLAKIHNDAVGETWAQGKEVPLEAWNDERWAETVVNVLSFQTSFVSEAAEKIDKYEALLQGSGMTLDLPLHGPDRLIPPYWSVRGSQDPWWRLSLAAINQAVELHGAAAIMPVLCLASETPTSHFAELIDQLPDGLEQMFCWRGAWDEATADADDIGGWLAAIDRAAMRNIKVVNMYGGALSILMTGLGLSGVNHGVGYSESRDEQRLSQTGAPPMRYYVPRLRQFLTVPNAQQAVELLDEPEDDWRCHCAVCDNLTTIVNLTTEELKLHFLLCRREEFRASADPSEDAIASARVDGENLARRFSQVDSGLGMRLAARGKVLQGWAAALDAAV